MQDLDELKQRCPDFIVSRCKPIKVAMKLRMPGSVSDYTPAKIDAIKADLASSAGVDASEITIDVQAGSVIVIATMPNSAAASVAVQIQSGTLTQLGGVAVPADSFEGSSSTDATAAAETIPPVAPSVAPSTAPSAVAIPKPVIAATPAPNFEARLKTFDTCFGSSLSSSAAPGPQACKCLTDAKADAAFWPAVVDKYKAQGGAAITDKLDTVVKGCQAGIFLNTKTTSGVVGELPYIALYCPFEYPVGYPRVPRYPRVPFSVSAAKNPCGTLRGCPDAVWYSGSQSVVSDQDQIRHDGLPCESFSFSPLTMRALAAWGHPGVYGQL